MGELHLKR